MRKEKRTHALEPIITLDEQKTLTESKLKNCDFYVKIRNPRLQIPKYSKDVIDRDLRKYLPSLSPFAPRCLLSLSQLLT